MGGHPYPSTARGKHHRLGLKQQLLFVTLMSLEVWDPGPGEAVLPGLQTSVLAPHPHVPGQCGGGNKAPDSSYKDEIFKIVWGNYTVEQALN